MSRLDAQPKSTLQFLLETRGKTRPKDCANTSTSLLKWARMANPTTVSAEIVIISARERFRCKWFLAYSISSSPISPRNSMYLFLRRAKSG